MDKPKSRFAMALDKLSSKTKDIASNIYLSQNPKSDLYCEDHIDHLNTKLKKHGYKIVNNEMQGGDWIEYGYQVQSFVPNASGDIKKKTIFFTESPSQLDSWLEKNLSRQLGWTQTPAQSTEIKFKAATPTAVRTNQQTMSI